ncbi:MAG: PD40 domain-containing protein [Planctomycetes bacterium]|nr:PD40 domain-containing protein [Planctomycetota bacterium]
MRTTSFIVLPAVLMASGFARAQEDGVDLRDPREVRLANVRQLTFGGDNAEAYFDRTGSRLVFQSTRDALGCDQIFTMGADGSDVRMVSSGKGRTTCAYFFPDGKRILYSSTHHLSPDCPPKPDYSSGYVWPLYAYDVFVADVDGGNPRPITDPAGYDAEATIRPDGGRIVFTSTRDGDIELYSMAPDGTDVVRLTHEEGYDGGAFYSEDGKRICYRAHHPGGEEEAKRYREKLARSEVEPIVLEIWVMDADGSNKTQVTSNGAANFCPFFHPSGEWIVFASNMSDPAGHDFDLYGVRADGSGLERITYYADFDAFPMFSPDGKKLVFASNRHGSRPRETNIFIADWVEEQK